MGFKGAKENLFDEKRIIKGMLSVWDQMKIHILRLDVPKHDVPFVDKGVWNGLILNKDIFYSSTLNSTSGTRFPRVFREPLGAL